jgi:hypothetical protein
MNKRSNIPAPAARLLVCARCGAEFACTLSSDCWCADQSAKLPVPDDGGSDCLCADCLRQTPKPPKHH